jgi:hypothetical protein
MSGEKNVVITIRSFAAHPNNAASRLRMLRAALVEVEAGASEGFVRRAQDSVKRALESLHELNDGLQRGEWSSKGWDATDVEIWEGIMGARNLSHHTSDCIVQIEDDPSKGDPLTWSIDPPALAELRSPSHAECFRRRVANEEVIPMLRRVAELLTASLP